MNKKKLVLILLLAFGGGLLMAENIKEAYFAGGCFWCMEGPFERLDGVKEVISGFAGGKEANPKYEDVVQGTTQHLESVKVIYDADKVDYQTLLNVFWRQIDPTDDGGQFADRGYQYTTAIFYTTVEEKNLAEASKKSLAKSGWFKKPIVTMIREFTTFYPAEEYHQDYYKKNSVRYKYYYKGSGREDFLKNTWHDEANKTDEIKPRK